MNKDELIHLLAIIVKEDETREIALFTGDHPCSVAIRAINQCFEDIKTLQSYAESATVDSQDPNEREAILVLLPYNPEWWLSMLMSERNELLIEFQEHLKTNVRVLVRGMEKYTDLKLTNEEITSALKHVTLKLTQDWGKIMTLDDIKDEIPDDHWERVEQRIIAKVNRLLFDIADSADSPSHLQDILTDLPRTANELEQLAAIWQQHLQEKPCDWNG